MRRRRCERHSRPLARPWRQGGGQAEARRRPGPGEARGAVEELPPPGVAGLGFVVLFEQGLRARGQWCCCTGGGCVCACGPAPALYGGESCVCENSCVSWAGRARGLESKSGGDIYALSARQCVRQLELLTSYRARVIVMSIPPCGAARGRAGPLTQPDVIDTVRLRDSAHSARTRTRGTAVSACPSRTGHQQTKHGGIEKTERSLFRSTAPGGRVAFQEIGRSTRLSSPARRQI